MSAPTSDPQGESLESGRYGWQPRAAEVDLQQAATAGLLATVIFGIGFVAVIFELSLTVVQERALLALVVVALIGSLAMAARARRAHDTRWAGWLLVVWALGDLLLMGAAFAATGGWQSPFIWLLVLPVVFFTTLLDTRSATVLLVLAAATPFAADAIGGDPGPHGVRQIILLTIVAVAGAVTTYLSRELRDRIDSTREAQRATERRARLLDATAAATRSLVELDPESVARELLAATVHIGFAGAWLAEVHEHGPALRVTGAVGLDIDRDTIVRPGIGISHLAVSRNETVVANDYATRDDAHPAVVAAGIERAIAVPVRLDGEPVAVLATGTAGTGPLRPEEQEALETLALHAGLALRNARLHAREAEEHRRRQVELERHQDQMATAAHELRTPLTVVHGLGMLLDERWEDLPEERRRDLAARMVRHSSDLVRLVERLHRLDELRRGNVVAAGQPLDLADVVVASLTALPRSTAEHLLTQYVPPDLRVVTDPGLVSLVLRELVANVLAHTPAGTHVHVGAKATCDVVEVVVADDGPGIPDEELADITAPFHRVGKVHTRESRGIGIGLTLVERTLELLGSSLSLESQPAGTTARFPLPRTHDHAQPVKPGVLDLAQLTTADQRRRSTTSARHS